ncbi:hypothetical protein PR202_gb07843 [Eleusine coracana subsp. coracana]|uniref:Uncharacterized protein n=1 Tax=Eleusine coracana subsp. coracana TaxID=191504 RepID=A0AAV5ECG6_ELECO|nr:hypothetical protein PR202_gb07843 [Eleusine coracana subsp. coracana]
MLRRNPTRIELRSSDRDELEEHLRAAAGSTPTGCTTPPPALGPQTSNPLLHLLHPPPGAAPSKAQRIGSSTSTPNPNPKP